MHNALAIARRELGAYFSSPVAYLVIAGFLLVTGLFFFLNLTLARTANLRSVFSTMYVVMLLLAPVLSMRLVAEEQRAGTIELLLTAPIRDSEIVVGKFLGAFGLLLTLLGLTLAYPAIVLLWGSPDVGVIVGGYVGAILFGAAALAIGLFASSLTQNQIVAAVLAFAALLALWIADGLAMASTGLASRVLGHLSLVSHFNDLARGVIDTTDVVYFLSLTVVALFLATRRLEARRWKG